MTDTLNFLPWNHHVLDKLNKMERAEQLGHAYLLQGVKGLGKESCALDFSASLFCQTPDSTSDQIKACGKCQACHLFLAGSHPDYKFLGLQEESSQIKIEQIRDSQAFLANTASMGRYKILVISPAEALNINAANALLKNLEEPSDGTLIFLISHRPGELLPTIRSRCQQIKFSVPNEKLALSWLEESMPKDQAEFALKLARGAPLKAVLLSDPEKQTEIKTLFVELLRLYKNQSSVVEASTNIGISDLEQVIDFLLLSLQELSMYLQISNHQAEKKKEILASVELQELAETLEIHLSVQLIKGLHSFHSELINTRKLLRSTANPNKQLLLESLLKRWLENIKTSNVKSAA